MKFNVRKKGKSNLRKIYFNKYNKNYLLDFLLNKSFIVNNKVNNILYK